MTGIERLSALDTSFLLMERPGVPIHVGSVATFEGGPLHDETGALRLAALRAEIEARLDVLPRLRRRVAWPPLGLGRPRWVDDPDFDIARHVDAVDLDGADDEGLRRCAETLMGELLPRDRPLWHMRFVTGLTGGRVALVERVHHALVDGVSGVDIAAVLLDLSPDAPRHDPVPWRPAPPPSLPALAADVTREWAATPVHAARALSGALRHPDAVARRAADIGTGLATAAADGLLAPRSSLNVPVDATRRLGWVRVGLDEVKAAGEPFGATANDVVLAAVAAGLRSLLVARGEPLAHDATLKVLVPVSLRGDGARGTLGNRVGALLLSLPIGIGDGPARLAAVAGTTARLKRRREATTAAVLLRVADAVPAPLLGPIVGLVHRQPLVNLVVTNVPGPPFPLYAGGARMLDAFPVVPLGGNLTLGVAILSYDGTLHLGLTADGERGPDLDRFGDGLEQGFAALGVAPTSVTAAPAADTSGGGR